MNSKTQDKHTTPAVVFDASAVRPPCAGVQLSVLRETASTCAALGNTPHSIISFDDSLSSLAPIIKPPPWANRPLGRAAWQQFLLPGLLKKKSASVLHALAYTCPLRCPVPVVLNVHDVIALERPDLCSLGNAWHMKTLLPGSIRRAARIIVSTKHVASRVSCLFPEAASKVRVLPLGVDFKHFSQPSPWPSILPFEAGKPFFLFVGNIEPKKDINTLLAAYSAIAGKTDAVLVMAGRMAWKSSKVAQAINKWNGPGKIYQLGRVTDKDLAALYKHARAFVFPSIEEGFGMPVLEAMAAGTPVIHSDHPALMEAAGNAGLSFPRGDSQALAKLLHLSNNSLSEKISAGLIHASNMTWDKWGREAANIINELL